MRASYMLLALVACACIVQTRAGLLDSVREKVLGDKDKDKERSGGRSAEAEPRSEAKKERKEDDVYGGGIGKQIGHTVLDAAVDRLVHEAKERSDSKLGDMAIGLASSKIKGKLHEQLTKMGDKDEDEEEEEDDGDRRRSRKSKNKKHRNDHDEDADIEQQQRYNDDGRESRRERNERQGMSSADQEERDEELRRDRRGARRSRDSGSDMMGNLGEMLFSRGDRKRRSATGLVHRVKGLFKPAEPAAAPAKVAAGTTLAPEVAKKDQ